MSAAYDGIAESYNNIRSKKNKRDLFEMMNVKSVIDPYVSNARVLELACGSGFYTFELLDWGAKSVVAVDNSEDMLSTGRHILAKTKISQDHIQFLAADCKELIDVSGAPFDLVFAAWLLPYAPDCETLTNMFRNVANNLKPGGRFVSVTTPPTSDPKASFAKEQLSRPPKSGQLYRELLHEVQDGICTRIHIQSAEEKDEDFFDAYRLKQEVYEKAAKDAGMTGEFVWIAPAVQYISEDVIFASNDPIIAEPEFGLLIVSK